MCFEWARSGEDMWVQIKWGLKMDGVGIEVGQIIKRLIIQILPMRRRTASKSPKKLPKRSTSPKKCNNCLATKINEVHISRSLYRKYSFSQNHIFLERVNHLQQTLTTKSLQNAAASLE
jgi:hypothetical protein